VVTARTASRYRLALHGFFVYLAQLCLEIPTVDRQLDQLVSNYIEYLWQEGEGRSRGCDTVSGLQWAVPAYKGLFKGSWGLLKAWQRAELPARAPPLPPLLLFAMAEFCCRQGNPTMAVCIVLAAHCILRTGEVLAIKVADVSFSPLCRDAIISLGETKGGQRRGVKESASVKLPWLVLLLKAACRGKSPADRIAPSPSAFRKAFDAALAGVAALGMGFRPYSLRRGGATELWRVSANLATVTLRGRWGSQTTARIYVNDGLARVAEYHLQGDEFETARHLASAFVTRLSISDALFLEH